jgi:hypothetical protein
MGKSRNGLVRRVLVEDKKQVTLTEHIKQESIQEAIFDYIHQKWFFLQKQRQPAMGPRKDCLGTTQ